MQDTLFKSGQKPLNPYKIIVLLVDDQPMIAEAIRRSLEDEIDIEFHYCPDPTKAIKIANNICPTIILQDLVMPEVNGLMMVKFFRVNQQTALVPVIILSTKEDPKVKSEAFALGVNDYIVKLPDKIELIARIRYHSKAYIHHKQRDEAFLALLESQKKLHEANKALETLSSLDGLTGIANRRQFDKKIQQEWQRSIRNTTTISLLMIDIDFFKNYNDTYGHQGGDFCLKEIANLIKESEKRSTDLAARYGGEEFALVLPETSHQGALDIANNLLVKVQEKNIAHINSDVADCVTISIGVATFIPGRGTNHNLLIEAADNALYTAKDNGRNQVVVASETPAPSN
jgi:two-component system chemotaxis family response regulator WspR